MKIKVVINPKTKTLPVCAILLFNFVKKSNPKAELAFDSNYSQTTLFCNDKKITNEREIYQNLSNLTDLLKINDSSAEIENKKLENLALECLPDRKKLPEYCKLLDQTLEKRTRLFLTTERVQTSDVFVWAKLCENKRWNILKKDKSQFPKLIEWYESLSIIPEFSSFLKFKLPNLEKNNKKENSSDINKNYKSLNIGIDSSLKGKVVTRFPPEPSGYLHIGHVKAAMLNSMVAEVWGGKMIVRFDDTNPVKEKEEYAENILRDLKTLKIDYWKMTHTSDYFRLMLEICEQLIKSGKAFVDDTPREEMKKERLEKRPSPCREYSLEKNIQMWNDMKNGKAKNIVRIKLDYSNSNGCLRDPTIYRCNAEIPHLRSRDKYKVYPTYDFSIPIVDTIEGVTNAFRSAEYLDRGEQYKRIWKIIFSAKNPQDSVFEKSINEILKTPIGLIHEEKAIKSVSMAPRPFIMPKVKTFSRANFVNTVLSKRKLTWFVDEGKVSGWDDPRFPTVQGIIRHGLTVEGLRQFTLSQGFSVNDNLMEWDRLWNINKRILDPTSKRFTAIEKAGCAKLHVENQKILQPHRANLHPKNVEMGTKVIRIGPTLFIEKIDFLNIKEGEEITLVEWGNVIIHKIDVKNFEMWGKLNPNGDVKKTQKFTWLADSGNDLVKCKLVNLSPLITVPKLEPQMQLSDCVNEQSWNETIALGDPNLRNLQQGEIVQLLRKGFAIVDKPLIDEASGMQFIMIPDGRTKPMVSKK